MDLQKKKKKKSSNPQEVKKKILKIVETKNLKNEISDLTLIVPVIRLNMKVYI